MSYYLLSAETALSAAHTLPDTGQCEQLHGHNWRIRLTVKVSSEAIDAHGMEMDFRVLEKIVHDAVADFDHTYLNNHDAFATIPPTAERIAKVVSDRAVESLTKEAPSVSVQEVEVWEMPEYRAVYRPE